MGLLNDLVNEVACPLCDAPAGKPCREPNGRVRDEPHGRRLRAYREKIGREAFLKRHGGKV